MSRRLVPWLALILWCALPLVAGAQPALAVKTLTDKTVTQAPAGPLYWRLESFASKAAAEAAAGPTGLAVELGGTAYLATLGPAGGATAGGTRVAEIGPIQLPAAARYLLRASEMTGPPGSESAVHQHPGAEVYYILRGELSVRSPAGTARAAAGEGLIGPAGGTPMQPLNAGATDLHALVLFAVDAGQAFSSPATLGGSPGLPNTGAGGGAPSAGWWAAPCGIAATILAAVAARLTRRRA